MCNKINDQEKNNQQSSENTGIVEQNNTVEDSKQILISASFTATPILPGLEFWKDELGLNYSTKILNYNQVFQELLNRESLFLSNGNGINVIMLRFEDWLPYPEKVIFSDRAVFTAESDEFQDQKKKLHMILNDFISVLRTFQTHAPCRTLLMICPASQKFGQQKHWNLCFLELNKLLLERTKDLSLLQVLIAEEFHTQYQVEVVDDPFRNEIGHIPFVDNYYDFLGTLLIRYYYYTISKEFKVIVLDCDNTLWKGVCGEVSPGELEVHEGFKEWQQFLVQQKEKGMLLCLCSKNVEADIWNVFEKRKDFSLQREHLTDYQINWQSKSKNIHLLAKTLNLGLESFIFIDDNPVECAEVRAHCPEVLTLQWPQSEDGRRELTYHTWEFDHFSVTEEDTKRTIMTQQNIHRESLLEECNNFNDFIEKLDLVVDILPIAPKNLARVSQLTKRTNQFNFTTIRRSEHDIQAILDQTGFECRIVNVKDRFGEYGLVGVLIFYQAEQHLKIDSFILSCRVLGRGVEHKMMAELGRYAIEQKLTHVKALFIETDKNKPVWDFLGNVVRQLDVETKINKTEQHTEYLFDATSLSDLCFIPPSSTQSNLISEKKQISSTTKKSTGISTKKDIKIRGLLTNNDRISQAVKTFSESTSYVAEDFKKTECNNLDKNQYFSVLKKIKTIFRDVLSIDMGKICDTGKFESYIESSLKIVELTVELKKSFPDISATFLFEYSSIAEIARELSGDSMTTNYSVIAENIHVPLADNMLQSDEDQQQDIEKNAIAIVAISGKFPMANDVLEFWNNICEGKDCITEIPENRWNWQDYYGDPAENTNKTNIKWGGFIDEVDTFDPQFFGISPKEAELMDPQQRLLMTYVWRAMEDGGILPKAMSQSSTGVFIAAGPSEYMNGVPFNKDKALAMTAGALSLIPNRISYAFDLHGPSEYVDSACSSTLVVLHRAIQSIHNHECEQAIVGAVNLLLSPLGFLGYGAMGYLSPEGKAKSFQDEANGYVRSEGVGVLIVKPLQKAIKDQDNIYAVIKGTGVFHGGKGVSLAAPNIKGMKAAMMRAYQVAKIDPQTVSYIEAHGVASPLSDGIEMSALKSGYRELAELYSQNIAASPCYISTLKPCIGNGEQVSGMAALIKVILAMRHKIIPGVPRFTTLNKDISLSGSPFQITAENHYWQVLTDSNGQNLPRRASINSFGSGGVNAHIIVEENSTEQEKFDSSCSKVTPQLVVLSAKNQTQLQAVSQLMLEFVEAEQEISLLNLAYTLQVGREAMGYRLAIVVQNREELLRGLNEYLKSVKEKKEIEITIPLFVGDREDGPSAIRSLISGKAEEVVLQMFLAEENLEKLAIYWIQGGEIPFELLHKKAGARRISLPRYPFTNKRYWISTQREENPQLDNKQSKEQMLKTTKSTQYLVKDNISEFIVQFLAQELDITVEQIKLNKNIQDYGADSIILMKLIRNLKKQFQIQVTIREMLEYPTIKKIVAHIEGKIPERNEQESHIDVKPRSSQKVSKYKDERVIEALGDFEKGNLKLKDVQNLIAEEIGKMTKRGERG